MSSLKLSATSRNPDLNNVMALAGVVIKEMYRRKDFYVLLVLVVVITVLLSLINFFHEENIVRYVKEACLLLVWLSSLVIAITTAARQIPAERESRTIFPLLAKPVGAGRIDSGQICRMLAGVRVVPGGVLCLFRVHRGLARTLVAIGGLFPSHLAALDLPGCCHCAGLAGIGCFYGRVFQRNDFFHRFYSFLFVEVR